MEQHTRAPDRHSGGTMLAESENVSVFGCSCGKIHLQIGPICLTMLPEEFTEMGTVVRRALEHSSRTGAVRTSTVN